MADKRINSTKSREEIAGISPGGYYNYTSKNSDRYGKVSLYTVKHLSSYFNLPQGIFDCTMEFNDKAKEKIAKNIKNNFSEENSRLIQEIKDLSAKLTEQEDLETLKKSSKILINTINILENKIEILKL